MVRNAFNIKYLLYVNYVHLLVYGGRL